MQEYAVDENADVQENQEQMAVSIEELEQYGVNKADVMKLKAGGYNTIESIAHTTLRKMQDVKGISEQKAIKVKDIIKSNELVPMGFKTASNRLVDLKGNIPIATGSTALDNLLGGGIETGSITEVFGEFRTGKTQFCHTLCVTVQLPLDQGGAEGRAIYVDCEGTFRPQKLVALAERFGVDQDTILDNVVCARAHNSEQQLELLTLYRTDYTGRGELSERQMHLAQFLRQLTRLAEEFGIAVVITNQVVANPDGMSFAKDATKPIGGNIIAHASTTRLKFKKGRGDNRVCVIYDSPTLPESEAAFSVGPAGIEDAKDI
eukprot:GSChrysophyteH1.ASY1.ANO1.173.1 assembled CDS